MQIPGVGKSLATDLVDIGIKSVVDLKGEAPHELFEYQTNWRELNKIDVFYTFLDVPYIMQRLNLKTGHPPY